MRAAQEEGHPQSQDVCLQENELKSDALNIQTVCLSLFFESKQIAASEVGAGSTAERCHLPRGQSHFCVWMGSFLENYFFLMAKCL